MIQLEATTNFGMEAVLKREAIALGMENVTVRDGLVSMEGDYEDIAKLNLWLRTAERVHWVLSTFEARSFEELFEGVNKIDWPEIMPIDANFVTEAKSQKSKLFSLSDIQSISEKAIVKKLSQAYGKKWFEKSGARFRVGIRIVNDEVSIYLDTSGDGLHNRGYRQRSVKAPLTETIAAGLVLLSYWNKDRILADPFCGSGTIPIEAAMIGRNIAPGLNRKFDFEYWPLEKEIGLKDRKQEAYSSIEWDGNLEIIASDIDPRSIKSASFNVEHLGLEDDIQLLCKDVNKIDYAGNYGILITNPPYGVRIEEEENVRIINQQLGQLAKSLDTWSFYVITSSEDFERLFKKKADRKRKLYNGRIKVDYYQYFGPKPPQN